MFINNIGWVYDTNERQFTEFTEDIWATMAENQDEYLKSTSIELSKLRNQRGYITWDDVYELLGLEYTPIHVRGQIASVTEWYYEADAKARQAAEKAYKETFNKVRESYLKGKS